MKAEGKIEQGTAPKMIREEKPIQARYLIAAGATIIFMLVSLMMVRAPEKNSSVNIPAGQPDQSKLDQIAVEENELITEDIKTETEAWLERFAASQRESVSDLKGINISELGPDEAYLVMRKEFEKVANMEDFTAFIEIYGSDKNIASIPQLRMIASLMGDTAVTEAVKAHFKGDIKSAEIVTSSKEKAVIKIFSGTGEEGEATMVFERGSWRFDEEKW